MKAILHLLKIVAAAILGGVIGSFLGLGAITAKDGVIGTTEALELIVGGGTTGALFAVITSMTLVAFASVCRWVMVTSCFAAVIGFMLTQDVYVAIAGWAVFASLLVDEVARRADENVGTGAAAPAAVKKPQSSGGLKK